MSAPSLETAARITTFLLLWLTAPALPAQDADPTPGPAITPGSADVESQAQGDLLMTAADDDLAGSPPADAAAAAMQRQQLLDRAIERYQAEIRRLEGAYGAYVPGVGEQLLGLGQAYQAAGRHEDAISVFRRAIHIGRIQEGLYNLNGIPILEELIESHVAMGNWEAVNNAYHFMAQLHNYNYPSNDPRRLPAIEKLAGWHLRAFSESVSESPLNHLVTARSLFNSTARILAVNFGDQDIRLAEPLRKRALVDYYLSMYAATSQGNGFERVMTADLDTPGRFLPNGYSSGKEALQAIRDIYMEHEAVSERQRTRAIVDLADWYLLFNQRQSAFATYDEAIGRLSLADPDGETMHEFFGNPVALPTNNIFDETRFRDGSGPYTGKGYLLVEFDVDEYGRSRDVKVVEAEPEDSGRWANQARRQVRDTRFRPRFVDGRSVATQAVLQRYEFYY